MAHSRASGCEVTAQRGQDGGDGGTDVAAKYNGAGQRVGNPALGAHNQGHGKCGRRALHDHCQYDTYAEEYEYRAVAHIGIFGEEGEHFGILLQVWHEEAYHIQTHEQETEAYQELSHALVGAFLHKQHGDRQCHQHDGVVRYVYLEGKGGDNPCGDGSAHIGAENHGHGLGQTHEAGVHETHHHHGGGGGALYERGDDYTGKHAGDSVLGHEAQNVAQTVAGYFLESFAHYLHAIQKQTYGAEQAYELK